MYKGTVTSIKEYGAFVEFNGGQQGLLHMSELSHEPVSFSSDGSVCCHYSKSILVLTYYYLIIQSYSRSPRFQMYYILAST